MPQRWNVTRGNFLARTTRAHMRVRSSGHSILPSTLENTSAVSVIFPWPRRSLLSSCSTRCARSMLTVRFGNAIGSASTLRLWTLDPEPLASFFDPPARLAARHHLSLRRPIGARKARHASCLCRWQDWRLGKGNVPQACTAFHRSVPELRMMTSSCSGLGGLWTVLTLRATVPFFASESARLRSR